MNKQLTERCRKALQLANQEAHRLNHEYIGTGHILLGLVKEGSGLASKVLTHSGLNLEEVRKEIEKIVQAGPLMVVMGKLPWAPKVKKALLFADEEAQQFRHERVNTGHLLVGLLRQSESVAYQVLLNLRLKPDDVAKAVRLHLEENPLEEELNPAVDPLGEVRYQIRSLEDQLANVRLVLSGTLWALMGALLGGTSGALLGMMIGGILGVNRWPRITAVAGGAAGGVAAFAYTADPGTALLALLFGAVFGFSTANIGRPVASPR